jgi:dihydrofolate synthase/folylpolyglutamate synthase
MDFEQSQQYLLSLGNEVTAMKLGLENIRKLLRALGEPQNKYLKVQVAGTNGKGSVCAFLNAICISAGVRVGMFTSPHLISITERVQINGVPICEDDFAKYATKVRSVAGDLVANGTLESIPTFFEQVTAVALLAFADANIELAILETGLGGRLDATTAANAEIAVITRIDYDHQEYLGETIEEIAAEKAAIIRPESLVCVGRQQPKARAVIDAKCLEMGNAAFSLDRAILEADGEAFDTVTGTLGQYANIGLDDFRYDEIRLSLLGEHQVENAALAILTAKKFHFSITDEQILKGLASATHPGRIEWINHGSVRILLDGAHNQSGASALASYLTRKSIAGITLVFAVMRDKDFGAILERLLPLAEDVILTEPKNSRTLSAKQVADSESFKSRKESTFAVADVFQAVDSAIQIAEATSGIVVITGSLYLVGEARRALREMRLV